MGSAGEDWSASEIAVAVATYGEMLRAQRAEVPIVKARYNERVQELTGRSRTSVDYKFCNISAILSEQGMEWVEGYAPSKHYQQALRTAVESVAPHW